MISIKDLCQITEFEDIQRAVKYHYPTDDNNYTSCYEYIKSVKTKEIFPDEELILSVDRFDWEDIDSELDNDEYYSIHTIENGETFAVSFRPWEDLASIAISEEALRNNTYAEILAHFIWEITFYGDQEQTKEVADSLKSTMKEVKEGTAKTIPIENLKDHLQTLDDE